MSISSVSSNVQQLAQRTGTAAPGSAQSSAQVSVLKQANDQQAQVALALISGIGQNVDKTA